MSEGKLISLRLSPDDLAKVTRLSKRLDMKQGQVIKRILRLFGDDEVIARIYAEAMRQDTQPYAQSEPGYRELTPAF